MNEDKSGWIKLHRRIQHHWLYQERRDFSRFEAWLDILMSVNHNPEKVLIQNQLIECNRGQSLFSLDTWAKRWHWDKSRVRRFLELLRNDHMIETENVQKTTRLTVCNYESYQEVRHAVDTQLTRKRHAVDTQLTPNKNEKNDKNVKNEKNIPFADFWEAYSKKKGCKKKTEKKWNEIPYSEKEVIMAGVAQYVSTFPPERYQYQPYPLTFLNERRWENEGYGEARTILMPTYVKPDPDGDLFGKYASN